MKKILTIQTSIKATRKALISTAAVLIVSILTVNVSCTKAPVQDELKNEFKQDYKNSLIANSFGTGSARDLQKGEYSLVQYTQKAYTSSPLEVGLTATDILDRIEPNESHPDTTIFKIKTREVSFDSEGNKIENHSVDEIEVRMSSGSTDQAVQKASQSQKSWNEDLTALYPISNPAGQQKGSDLIRTLDDLEESSYAPCSLITYEDSLPSNYRVTFHELSQSVNRTDPPESVKKSPTCGGVPDCKITASDIEYDEVLWAPNGSNQKFRCIFRISPDTPYFSAVLKRCVKFLATIADKKVPIESCANTINFQFGEKP
jgi:hypothetical protein